MTATITLMIFSYNVSVNCVGTGPQSVANLIDQPEDQASQIIRVNLMSTIKVNFQ